MKPLYEIMIGEHSISIFERNGYVMLIINEAFSRSFVKAEMAMVGYNFKVNVLFVPGIDIMNVSFPGSAEVCYERLINSNIFGWK